MKKILAMLLCALLALTLFAACGGGGEEEPTTDEIETTDAAAGQPTTTEAATAVGADEATDAPTTQEAETTAAQTTDEFPPPANLNTLSKAEQLAYFNLVANRVRAEKPGFKNDTMRKIDKITLSGGARVANPIVEMVKNQLMPGNWDYETIAKGKGNDGKFFSENANASDLKESDITSITSTKNGESWIIKVNVIQEKNPAKKTGSANSRINCIASRQEVLDEITGISSVIKADINNATLTYHDGYATLTVNAKGQVTSAECGFQVSAVANEVKISIITTNVQAPQSSVVKSHDFIW